MICDLLLIHFFLILQAWTLEAVVAGLKLL